MTKFNFKLSYFWDAVHPVFRTALFFLVSFWGSQHIEFPPAESGVFFWWILFSLAFFVAAVHTLFWMDWNPKIQYHIGWDTGFDPNVQISAYRSITKKA